MVLVSRSLVVELPCPLAFVKPVEYTGDGTFAFKRSGSNVRFVTSSAPTPLETSLMPDSLDAASILELAIL